jgi:hypothetical protein
MLLNIKRHVYMYGFMVTEGNWIPFRVFSYVSTIA